MIRDKVSSRPALAPTQSPI